MRGMRLALVVLAALAIAGCSSHPIEPGVEPQPTDALLAAASAASTMPPVAIVGYAFMFRQTGTGTDGTRSAFTSAMVVMKSGALMDTKPYGEESSMSESRDASFETSIARLEPEAEIECIDRLAATTIATETIWPTWDGRFVGIEPFIRRYVVEDSAGNLFFITPDGNSYVPAPPMSPSKF